MAVRPIYVAPHPVLKTPATPIEGGVTDELRQLMDDMLDTMYDAEGIGLAAPQIGISKRVLVLDVEQGARGERGGTRGNPICFVNPEIVWTSDEINTYEEGCLSIPGQYAPVERPSSVRVKYLDYDGNPQEIEADGLLATCVQHEIDHLDGILFLDHVSKLKRDMLMRKLKKWTKENAEDIKDTHILL